MKTYTVQPGDSLSKIARDVLGDMSLWPEIARLNNIANPNLIHPGQMLNLPGAQANEAEKKKDNKLLIAGAAAAAAVLIFSTRKKKSHTKKKRK